jgi:ribose 5-phosphate isomerase A
MVDETKLVKKLGTKSALPIEVAQGTWERAVAALETLGCTPVLRRDQAGAPKTTDQNNYLVDCRFANGIDDAYALAKALDEMPEVIAHGLFLDMASVVVVGADAGTRRISR